MEVLDFFAVLLALVFRWRVLLCLGATSALAVVIVQFVPGATLFQGLLLALTGVFTGAAWQGKSAGQQPASPPAFSSRFVMALSLIFIGALWGLASSASVPSLLSGAAMLAASLAGFAWHQRARSAFGPISKLHCAALVSSAYVATGFVFVLRQAANASA